MTHLIGQITNPNEASLATIPLALQKPRYCLYARKSSEAEERQALSIDSQVKEMLAVAERDDLEVVDIRREAHSAKDSGQRPIFKELLEDIRQGRFNAILTWNPDRLSRNAGDLGSLVDLMDQKILFEIRTHGQVFSNSPNEKFLLMILCSQAKLENDNKGINVKRGLKMRCEMGLWPAPAPTGYLNENRSDRRGYVIIDPERGHIIKQMFEKVAYEKWSGKKLHQWLTFDLNFRSAYGNKHLTLSNIYLILENTFYYGVYEYPRKSDNWYRGKHTPLITKELFDQVQEQVKTKILKAERKEFAFARMMTCGLCGSGVCADEKFKKLKNGDINRYVYYTCTKYKDKYCRSGYTREESIIEQFKELANKIDFEEGKIREKIKIEAGRMKKFNLSLFGKKEKMDIDNIDIRNYIKYILCSGTNPEKREILSCMKNNIILKNKILCLSPSC